MTNVYKPIFILFSVSFLVSILFQVSFGEEKGQSLDKNFPCNRNNLEITPFRGNATANEGFKPGFEKPKEENGDYIFNIDGYAYFSSATVWRDTSGQISKRIYADYSDL